jgi:hypothetical protein
MLGAQHKLGESGLTANLIESRRSGVYPCNKNTRLPSRLISQKIGPSSNRPTAYAHQNAVGFDAALSGTFCRYFKCKAGHILYFE